MKKLLSLLLAVAMVLSLAVCAGTTAKAEAEGSVYYLNFKPEQDEAWQNLAKVYTETTGVPVTVLTAASGTYEQTLMAEMGKSEAPTLFQVNGPNGLADWIDYCYDLSGSELYSHLSNESFALSQDGAVYGIGYVTETYGIIVNKALLEKAGHTVDEINSFETLKAVVEDITARSEELGFAAFSSAGMESSSDWRFKTHLANLPIYFEYQEDGIDTTTEIKGTFLDNYRAIWDLYINNSTCDPAELSAKTGADSLNEFLNGEAVFYQNGTWAYGDLSGTFADDEMTMIPIYIGAGDEANQGLFTGCENFWCVNKDADQADIDATLAFLNWCVTDSAEALAKDMNFVIPFDTAVEAANPFTKIGNDLIAEGKIPVAWTFTTMPSDEWKNMVGQALTAYAADQTDANWDAVVTAFVDGWASEYAMRG